MPIADHSACSTLSYKLTKKGREMSLRKIRKWYLVWIVGNYTRSETGKLRTTLTWRASWDMFILNRCLIWRDSSLRTLPHYVTHEQEQQTTSDPRLKGVEILIFSIKMDLSVFRRCIFYTPVIRSFHSFVLLHFMALYIFTARQHSLLCRALY